MTDFKITKFPKSRLATFDICDIGKLKHHISALIELDITNSREKIKKYNKGKTDKISFNAWLISTVGCTIKKYEAAASYLKGKRKIVIFDDINISMLVEKEIDGQKVPIPLVIEKASEKSIESISRQINEAKNEKITNKDIVLRKKTSQMEKMYYVLPGFIRKYVWRYMLKHPRLAYSKMGNVAFTSVGMMGSVNGWFIPISIHPVCFGISSIIKKPVVIENKIEIREILKMTILIDHDVIDGAPMARFISELAKNIESGLNLNNE